MSNGFDDNFDYNNEDAWVWDNEDSVFGVFLESKGLFIFLVTGCLLCLLVNGVKILNTFQNHSFFSLYGAFLVLLEVVFLFYLIFFLKQGKYRIPMHSCFLILSFGLFAWVQGLSINIFMVLVAVFIGILSLCRLSPLKETKENRKKTKSACADGSFSPLDWFRMHRKRYSVAEMDSIKKSLEQDYEKKVTSLKEENKNLRREVATLIREKDDMERMFWQNRRSYKETFESFFNQKTPSANCDSSFSFFEGCTSASSVKKRYTKLSSAFHPDNSYGNEKIMKQLNEQYQKELRKYN